MIAGLKRRIDPNVRFTLRTQVNLVRERGPLFAARWNAMLVSAKLRDRLGRRHYRVLSESELIAARKSDTVFVFGSGASLNALLPDEWEHFAEHDVFGFNAFYNEHWVPVNFHIVRGGVYGELRWRTYAEHIAGHVRGNPLYRDTIFLMQDDYLGHMSNQLVGHRLLPEGARIFRYRTTRTERALTHSFAEGVRHTIGTLEDAVNCAYLMGWRRIVLVGVDLYDNRYFFLPEDQTPAVDRRTAGFMGAERDDVRGNRFDDVHSTAQAGIVEQMSDWAETMSRGGVELAVYNPRSLLAEVLPVYGATAAV